MARGPYVDVEIKEMVGRWVAKGERSPAAIYRALVRELDERYKNNPNRPILPTERTIARLVRAFRESLAQAAPDDTRPREGTGFNAAPPTQAEAADTRPWILASAAPEEAAVILPVLGAILKAYGRLAAPTIPVGVAKWVVRVSKAVPTIPPLLLYEIALDYYLLELAARTRVIKPRISPLDLDAFLACRPWESEEAARQYERLLELEIIRPVRRGRWWQEILELEQGGKDREETPWQG